MSYWNEAERANLTNLLMTRHNLTLEEAFETIVIMEQRLEQKGSGQYSSRVVQVKPGDTIEVKIGSGGVGISGQVVGGNTGGRGSAGGVTSFGSIGGQGVVASGGDQTRPGIDRICVGCGLEIGKDAGAVMGLKGPYHQSCHPTYNGPESKS